MNVKTHNMLFSYDSHGHLDHHPDGGWKGFLYWLLCMAISGGAYLLNEFILPFFQRFAFWQKLQDLDKVISVGLHFLSGVSLIIGITVGIITIQDKLRARKK